MARLSGPHSQPDAQCGEREGRRQRQRTDPEEAGAHRAAGPAAPHHLVEGRRLTLLLAAQVGERRRQIAVVLGSHGFPSRPNRRCRAILPR